MTAIDLDQDWTERIRRTQAAFPQSAENLTIDETSRAVRGEELLVRVLRDMLAVDNVEVRRSHRPLPDIDKGRQLLAELRGEDYTVEPFHVAAKALAGTRSLAHLKRRTGLSKSNLGRLLRGEKRPPTPEDMEAYAAGFGKRPLYFAEYRSAVVSTLIYEHLMADPDRSAVLAHQMGLAR